MVLWIGKLQDDMNIYEYVDVILDADNIKSFKISRSPKGVLTYP